MMALVVFSPSLVQPNHIEPPLTFKLTLLGKDKARHTQESPGLAIVILSRGLIYIHISGLQGR